MLAIYGAASWVIYEVVHSLTEGLGLPDWFPGLAVVLLLVGLPNVLATALVQERLSPTARHDPTKRLTVLRSRFQSAGLDLHCSLSPGDRSGLTLGCQAITRG